MSENFSPEEREVIRAAMQIKDCNGRPRIWSRGDFEAGWLAHRAEWQRDSDALSEAADLLARWFDPRPKSDPDHLLTSTQAFLSHHRPEFLEFTFRDCSFVASQPAEDSCQSSK